MNRFEYVRATDPAEAVRLAAAQGSRFLAGGTNLVDLLKENVERPGRVIDIRRLALGDITQCDNGGLRLGALATNADTAYHPEVQSRYPLLASAILAGASPQLRNAATNGGNLNQRPRCYYFYDTAAPCNKREPGAGCSAIGGLTRIHAILGTSEACIATHPSDMCVALAALDAQVRIQGPSGERTVALADYHRLPGADPSRDTSKPDSDLVLSIDLPPEGFSTHYSYLKLRDRLSYAFALVSVAAAVQLDESGRIICGRIALGGVAHKPWRVPEAEALLLNQMPSQEVFLNVADRLLQGAKGQGDNDFKIELARRAIVRALRQAAQGTPQSQSNKQVA